MQAVQVCQFHQHWKTTSHLLNSVQWTFISLSTRWCGPRCSRNNKKFWDCKTKQWRLTWDKESHASGVSQATIMSYVRRRNFLSARWPVTWTERASVLKQQYSKKFLAYTDGCFMESEASSLKLFWRSIVEIPRILHFVSLTCHEFVTHNSALHKCKY